MCGHVIPMMLLQPYLNLLAIELLLILIVNCRIIVIVNCGGVYNS